MAAVARASAILLSRNTARQAAAKRAASVSAIATYPLPPPPPLLYGGALTVSRCYGSSSKGTRRTKKHESSSSDSDSSDSDSEWVKKKRGKGGKKGQGQSEFWLRKMRTHHVAMDINKDGVVSWDDFQKMIDRFRTTGLLTPEEETKLVAAIKHVWEEEWGASGDPYAFINQEQFITNMEHVVNDPRMRKKVAGVLPYFFEAVDSDNSGSISVKEFKTYFECLGLSNEAAVASFAAIDLNNDGTLTKKEFVKLGRDFFLTEDETRPSKLFWGPLV